MKRPHTLKIATSIQSLLFMELLDHLFHWIYCKVMSHRPFSAKMVDNGAHRRRVIDIVEPASSFFENGLDRLECVVQGGLWIGL